MSPKAEKVKKAPNSNWKYTLSARLISIILSLERDYTKDYFHFRKPISEMFSADALADYKSKIAKPMDFRTVLRVSVYFFHL